jgi:ABC-type Mn2+/Zn2+ transport system permease subunit
MAPLATLMGMPMPLAIRLVSHSAPELIPWAWGVNGATSVLGSVLALVVAIASGFNQALIAGAALYLLACVFILRVKAIENSGGQSASFNQSAA